MLQIKSGSSAKALGCSKRTRNQGFMFKPFQPAVKCHAAQSSSTDAPSMPATNAIIMNVMGSILKFPPIFEAASKNAKKMIVKRAEQIGIDWDGTMKQYQSQDWGSMMTEVMDTNLTYPDYYRQPFHAYKQGNLSWDAAHEVTCAAKSVHALVMDPENKVLDPEGDRKMRQSFNQRTREQMSSIGADPNAVNNIVDLGCATGLSSLALLEAFPGSSVIGVDLSPHFLTVGKFEQQQREAASGQQEQLRFIHGNAESTPLPDGSADLVSICLVLHECPADITKKLFREAYRLLRPGGCLAVMEVDQGAPTFQRILSNPIIYSAFKSTEPWLEEYVNLDMHGAMREAGFTQTSQQPCTCRHRAVVAYKA